MASLNIATQKGNSAEFEMHFHNVSVSKSTIFALLEYRLQYLSFPLMLQKFYAVHISIELQIIAESHCPYFGAINLQGVDL